MKTLIIDAATCEFLATLAREKGTGNDNSTVILKLETSRGGEFLNIASARTPLQSEDEAERYVVTKARSGRSIARSK